MNAHRFARFSWIGLFLLAVALGGCSGFVRWLEGEPESIRQFRSAQDLFEKEKYDQAAVAFRAWLADYRDKQDMLRPTVLYKLGECYRITRDYERAIVTYKTFIQLYSDSPHPKVKELLDTAVRPKLDDIMPRTKPERGTEKSSEEPPGR